MYQRILVPLDGSETAAKILPVVIQEAQCHQATVVLLRVIPPLRHSLMISPALLEQINLQSNQFATDYLKQLSDRLSSLGLDVESHILSGPPAQRILDFAESSQCDLIIIGTRGETGALRWRFGGVAYKIVKTQSNMPVLVVNT